MLQLFLTLSDKACYYNLLLLLLLKRSLSLSLSLSKADFCFVFIFPSHQNHDLHACLSLIGWVGFNLQVQPHAQRPKQTFISLIDRSVPSFESFICAAPTGQEGSALLQVVPTSLNHFIHSPTPILFKRLSIPYSSGPVAHHQIECSLFPHLNDIPPPSLHTGYIVFMWMGDHQITLPSFNLILDGGIHLDLNKPTNKV